MRTRCNIVNRIKKQKMNFIRTQYKQSHLGRAINLDTTPVWEPKTRGYLS